MQNILFIELWYAPLVIFVAFMYFFLQSFLLLGDLVTSNPLFEKRRLKHLHRFSSFISRITPVVLLYYATLFCKNSAIAMRSVNTINSVHIYLPLFFLFLYFFLLICDRLFIKEYSKSGENVQHINTSGLFIVIFIPVATAMISAKSILELLLPLEFLGLIFYFIFLEFNLLGTSNNSTPWKHNNQIVVRGLLYYFWLSFTGSLLFIIAILLYSVSLPTGSYEFISKIPLQTSLPAVYILAAAMVFTGLTIKMGGLFFFFFKADLYKYLPVYGVLLLSVYTSFFYLILLLYLVGAVPFFGVSFKYLLSACLVGITLYLLAANNLSQRNVLTLAALSSVLTLCLCILILAV